MAEKLDLEIRQRIIDGSMHLFNQYGVRSVTMDDVAREVSMSKKTLYQYFTNKDGLVTAAAKSHIEQEKVEYAGIAEVAENAIDELRLIGDCMRKDLRDMNPSLLFDLQKFHREAWDAFLDFKNEFIRGNIEQNLQRGIAEGYYREDLDVRILSRFRVEQVQMIFDPRVFSTEEYSFLEVQMQLYHHFVYGLLTEKGRRLFNDYNKNEAKTTIS
ncbi:MAG: TetR/AcrR family transcriptional regulator [Bacteroidota bacterium]